MGLHRFRPVPSGRMGTLWTLTTIRDGVVVEFGCMGHMNYARVALDRAGIPEACKLYATHLDEADVSLGGTDRLSRVLASVIEAEKPSVVFLLPSSVPEIIGTDLQALCRELQPDYPNTRLIPFGQGGFKVNQQKGIQEALLLLAKTLPLDRPLDRPLTPVPTFNLIGSCADLFRFQADRAELLRIMEGAFGMEPLCILTSDTSIKQIEEMGGAHINLVLRRQGEPAAKELERRFGIPYLLGRPYGIRGTAAWIKQVGALLGITPDPAFIEAEREEAQELMAPIVPMLRHYLSEHPDELALSLGGHADVVKGIRAFGCQELGLPQGACWCDDPDSAEETLPYWGEDRWMEALQARQKGVLMASGEVLEQANRNQELQIANPDSRWRLNPYMPPFVGFRGAIRLADLWINEILKDH